MLFSIILNALAYVYFVRTGKNIILKSLLKVLLFFEVMLKYDCKIVQGGVL